MAERTCRGPNCDARIVFGRNPATHASIPLDGRPPVYRLRENAQGELEASQVLDCMVSHFAVCPDANQFGSSAATTKELRELVGEMADMIQGPGVLLPPDSVMWLKRAQRALGEPGATSATTRRARG